MSASNAPPEINPGRVLVLCFEFGGWTEDGHRRWLPLLRSAGTWVQRTFPPEHVKHIHGSPIDCARNRAIREELLPVAEAFDWVLSIDNDVTLNHPGLERFLAAPGDAVACRSFLGNPRIWDNPREFHCTFYRARTEIFLALPPPWFQFGRSMDGCELLTCECVGFAGKAAAGGFDIHNAGYCGHSPSGSWCYHSARGEEFYCGNCRQGHQCPHRLPAVLGAIPT